MILNSFMKSKLESDSNNLIFIKKLLFSSSDYNIFLYNYTFWLFINTLFVISNGFNTYSFFIGLFMWSFWEYFYHRFILHFLENTEYYYKLHGYHHMYPDKSTHIPGFQYILVEFFIILISTLFNKSYVYSYSIGHMLGLFSFENMHYYIHKNKDSNQVFIKYHIYHHKNSHKKAHCFTSPLFDIIFNTFPYNNFEYNLIAYLPIPYLSFNYGVSYKKIE
jgi:hypothetical protein